MSDDVPFPFARLIRIITIPPIMALLTLGLLFLLDTPVFDTTSDFVLSLGFLVLFPLLGYPLQPLIPRFKEKGREGQRHLAMVTAVVGYIGGILHSVIGSVSAGLWIIYLSYLVSGVGVMVFNKLLKIRASGHTCGVAGPIALLVYFLGPIALAGALLLVLVMVASIQTKRHTLPQLIAGACIPVVSMLLSIFACNNLIFRG